MIDLKKISTRCIGEQMSMHANIKEANLTMTSNLTNWKKCLENVRS